MRRNTHPTTTAPASDLPAASSRGPQAPASVPSTTTGAVPVTSFQRASAPRFSCPGHPLYALLALFVLCSATAAAFGITPAHAETTFLPGDVFTNRFTVINDEKLKGSVHLSVEGELTDLVMLDATDYPLGAESMTIPYKVVFPKNVPPGGEYLMKIFAEPKVESQGSVAGASVRLAHKLLVKVPYHGKAMSIDIDASSSGLKLNFLAAVRNIGAQDIDALSVTFNLYDGQNDSNLVLTAKTDTQSLSVGQRGAFNLSFDASQLLPGVYAVRATADFDGNTAEATRSYTHGMPNIVLVSVPSSAKAGHLNQFDITVRNEWNEPVRGVYGDVEVRDAEGKPLLSFRTETLDIGGRQLATFSPFLDARHIPASTVDVSLMLHPDKARTYQYDTSVRLIEPKEYDDILNATAPQTQPLINPAGPLAVLIINIILLLYVIARFIWGGGKQAESAVQGARDPLER